MSLDDRTIPLNHGSLWALRVLVVTTLGMGTLLALLPAAGHDQLWFLLMADRWLHGSTLYGPEIFDSNTPTVVWLSAIPVVIAHAIGWSAAATGKLLVLLLGAGLTLLSIHSLPITEHAGRKSKKTFLAFAFISLWMVTAARDFGQRDHLTAMLCVPYVLVAGGRSASFRTHLLVGLLAAAGVCLKPQQALVPLVIEAAVLLGIGQRPRSLRKRIAINWQRPEPAILLIVGVFFLWTVAHFAPLYFSLALPTLLSTYWAIGHLTLFSLAKEAAQLHFLGLLVLTVYFVKIRRTQSNELGNVIEMLLIAGFGATAAYYFQGTGWYYQQLPAITFFGLAGALEAIIVCRGWQGRVGHWAPFTVGAMGVLALALTIHYSGYPFSGEMFSVDRRYAFDTPDPGFFRALPRGTPVATLTTSVDDAMMPVARYDLTWAQRTNNLWTLPAILRAQDNRDTQAAHAPRRLTPERLAMLAAQQRLWMVEDIQRWQPKLVLVARCQAPGVHCQELEDRHDDLLAFFLADPAFVDTWRHYTFVRTSGPYDAYELTKPF